jgi:hypothetical protein
MIHVVRNKCNTKFTDDLKAKSIEYVHKGFSLNKIARMVQLSNSNPIREYLRNEHPEVYQIAVDNGLKTRLTYRKGIQ